jgi:hypothetical protein
LDDWGQLLGFPLSAHIHKSLVKRFLNGFCFFFRIQLWLSRLKGTVPCIQFDLYRANTLCVGVSLWIFLNSCDPHPFFFSFEQSFHCHFKPTNCSRIT